MSLEIIDVIISGLITGAVYALMAMGLTLIYGVTKAFNFAYGSFYTMGGYIAWMLLVPIAIAGGYFSVFLLAVPLLFGIGYLLEKFLVAPLRKYDDWEVKVMMVTLGLSLFLDNGYMAVFGGRMKSLPAFVSGQIEIGGAVIMTQDLVIFILAVGGMLCFRWILRNTRTGLAVEAVAQNPAGAQIVGIRKEVIFASTFAISTIMVGLGGILLSQKYFVAPVGGGDIMIKSWVVTAFGGMGSVQGSLYAAFILGMLEAMVGWLFGMDYVMISIFVVLLTTLAVRPKGLMGRG
ncbi:MAG: branched-chain amino acid ABC transporter permease [Syntrophobacteraceae bacterium]